PPSHDHQRGVRAPHSQFQTVGGGERERWGRLASIEGDQRESGTTHEKIGGPHGDIAPASTAHPQDAPDIDPRRLRALRVKRAVGIDEGAHAAARQAATQTREEKAGAPRGQAAHDLRDRAAPDDVASVAHCNSFSRISSKTYHMLSSRQDLNYGGSPRRSHNIQ